MMSGMGRVFSYKDSAPNPQIAPIKDAWQTFISDDNMWHFSTFLGAQSNGVFPSVTAMNSNYVLDATGATDYKGNFETEAHFGRLFGDRQFLEIFVGADVRRLNAIHNFSPNSSEYAIENRTLATLGGEYLLPMFIQTDLRIDHTGRFRLQMSRSDLALTSRLRLGALWNTDKEYDVDMRYIVTKRFSISADYDSHFGAGGGITFTY